METVLIQGLDDEGPGDIVGAIAHQAEIAGELIGNIEINDDYATVEIDSNVADLVVEKMDGNKIGQSEVQVRLKEDGDEEDIETATTYAERFDNLVELEREEEMRQHEQEIRQLSGSEREAKGRALTSMRGREEGEGIEGVKVKFMKTTKGQELPDTEIAVGDLVMVSKNDPLRDDNPTGTVIERTKYSVTVAFETDPPGFVYGNGVRLDLYVNDITYQRMKDALDELENATGRLRELRKIITGTGEPDPVEPREIDTWFNPELNGSQQAAVRRALGADDFYLIHGPPGTGKTTTAIEVIEQEVAAGRSVLATAASNTAVDNVLEFLLRQDVDAVRVGHPARVTSTLHEHTLDYLVEQNETYQEAQELRDQAFEVLDKQDELKAPSGRYRRGMSDEKIKRLAERGQGSRGVPAEKIEEMAEWLELQEEADELFQESDRLEQEAIDEMLDGADVVCTTNSTAGSDLLADREFDVLVLDEATQATEPSCLIPITHADTVVMAGDHRQLPPTVKNQEAARKGMETTLFEKLAEEYGDRIMDMLTVQYRMHEDIMGFSSREFYDGGLEAAPDVGGHTLTDLDLELDEDMDLYEALEPLIPVVFLDTSSLDAAERSREGSTSKENRREAELVERLADGLLDAGMDGRDIAVIAPYKDQVDRLEQLLGDGVEVDTVDGFQGREKEVVIISLTRSNEEGRLGFLEDVRRLNVALTRAKRKLIVVGDGETLRTDSTYATFIDYVDEHGRHVEL
ncbi:MAG: IGHMBP2 family helicase [Candidatus Nanohaloarchaea archaeon]|nr:IGHMBP2 family helicase [Candidatus Nanohaloarchaea archaeon]